MRLPLFEKVKYVLRQPHICRGRSVNYSHPGGEPRRPIRQLTRLQKRPAQFHLRTHIFTYTHAHSFIHASLWHTTCEDLTLIRFISRANKFNSKLRLICFCTMGASTRQKKKIKYLSLRSSNGCAVYVDNKVND